MVGATAITMTSSGRRINTESQETRKALDRLQETRKALDKAARLSEQATVCGVALKELRL
jgi:hypothetical protein